MSQNNQVIPTTGTRSGLELMQDANAAIDSLNTANSGNTKPTNGTGAAFPTGAWWLDTTNSNQKMVCMSDGGVDTRLFPLAEREFQARAQNSPNMTVTISKGTIFTGTAISQVAAQTTSAFTAPVGNPRIDRIVLDPVSGTYSIVAGTPAASPVPPAIPIGKIPVCQIGLAVGQSSITNSSILNEYVNSEALTGLFFQAAFGAYRSTAQSFASATFVKIQFDVEEYDTNSAYDNATNYRFTAPRDGIYSVAGGINFATGGVSVIMDIYKNGAIHKRICNSTSTQSGAGSAQVKLLAGDYIELYAFQSGATQNGGGSLNTTYFQAAFLRGL